MQASGGGGMRTARSEPCYFVSSFDSAQVCRPLITGKGGSRCGQRRTVVCMLAHANKSTALPQTVHQTTHRWMDAPRSSDPAAECCGRWTSAVPPAPTSSPCTSSNPCHQDQALTCKLDAHQDCKTPISRARLCGAWGPVPFLTCLLPLLRPTWPVPPHPPKHCSSSMLAQQRDKAKYTCQRWHER